MPVTECIAVYIRLSSEDNDVDGSIKAESNSVSAQRSNRRYHLFVLQRIRCECKRLCQCRRIYRAEGFDRFGSYRSIIGDKRKNILQSEK